jgi:DNA-directed RNA polymerase specialized sigma24 family protein
LFAPGIVFLLARALPADDLPERVHDVLLAVVRRIRDSELERPDALLALVREVVREHILAYLRDKQEGHLSRSQGVPADGVRPVPADSSATPDHSALMEQALRRLTDRDREALDRFYVLGQTEERILAEMNLPQEAFRLLKSGVRAEYLAKRRRTPAVTKRPPKAR